MARRSEHWLCRIHSMHSAGPWPISIQLLYFHLILWIRNQSMMRWLLFKNNTEHTSIDLILKIVEKIKLHTKKYTGFQYGTALAISGNWMFNAIFKCCFCVVFVLVLSRNVEPTHFIAQFIDWWVACNH